MILSVLKLSNLPIKWTALSAMSVAFLDLCSVKEATHNKAFKRDSQRLAVSFQSLAYVFMAQWFRLGGGVVHPLTRR